MEKITSVAFSSSLPERGQPRRRADRAKDGPRGDDGERPEEHGQPRDGDVIPVRPGENLRVEIDPVRGTPLYLGVAAATGEILRRYEPEEALRLIGRVRQVAGLTLDTNL
jgi:hypothetical protein